ncbi:MAG: sulfate adenylyltransferase, partial [Rhodocyclaceae bacterium]
AAQVGIGDVTFLPLSALNGDMVVDRGDRLDWYQGPTLLDILEAAPSAHSEHAEPFRFPVQYVCRPQASEDPALHDFRGYMGRVEAGTIAVGDQVRVLPAGSVSRISEIRIGNQSVPRAIAEQSVTLLLEDDIDLSRGDLIVAAADELQPRKQLDAMVCWLSEVPLDLNRRYLVRHTTREVKALVAGIAHRLDINTLERAPTGRLNMNDIGKVSLKLAQPVCADPYATNRTTGAFIVIDEATNNTVGAGMIL